MRLNYRDYLSQGWRDGFVVTGRNQGFTNTANLFQELGQMRVHEFSGVD
jgi:hypothetical protein